jgi:two-component sensor histidine kinase
MKLLIIDDQPQVTNSLKEAIEPGGHECIIFNHPQKALSHFEKEYFDVVLTDLKMPDMDGIQVLRTIQQLRPGTPVIILTGYADTGNTIDAVNFGAHAFFQKPVQINELMESLHFIEKKIHENLLKEIQVNQLKAEKEIISNELKQRLNQNLQLVSSLLRLQSGKIDNEQARQALKSAYHRIHTIALIQDRLYNEGNQAKLNLADYIQRYMNTFFQANQLRLKSIHVEYQMDPVSVDVNRAIPWGLVFNELISNAVAHAFTENNRSSNQIQIKLSRDNQNIILLTVCDNGIGLGKNFNINNCQTLGMNLISNIVQYQLNGHIEINSDSGTCITIYSQES